MNDLRAQAFNLKDEGRTYLDHNATTPLASELVPYIQENIQFWGNPSSIHQTGRGPKAVLRKARQNISQLIGCSSLEVIFTSCGSESNNQVLKSVILNAPPERNELIVSAVEHPSVLNTAKYLAESHNTPLHIVPVNKEGQLDMAYLKKVLSEKTALVSVMAANNETGHLFPIKEIAKLAHESGAFMHTDAVQMLGKLTVDVRNWNVDFASFSGHKFYSLKGCGVIYQKRGHALASLIHGGAQERRRRAGTENTLAIGCLGRMAEFKGQIAEQAEKMQKLRDNMEVEIQKRITGIHITGASQPRLPNTSSLWIEGIDGETLLMNLDIEGFSVSTGAACSSGNPEPSPVLLAMGLTRPEAQASLRLAIGWSTTEKEIKDFINCLEKIVQRIRQINMEAPSV